MQMLTEQERVRRLRPANSGKRIRREKRTIEAMLDVDCRDHHHDAGGLCGDCANLLRYARQRLDNCVFGESKMPCNCCNVHCYSAKMRGHVVEVMRFGPADDASLPDVERTAPDRQATRSRRLTRRAAASSPPGALRCSAQPIGETPISALCSQSTKASTTPDRHRPQSSRSTSKAVLPSPWRYSVLQ